MLLALERARADEAEAAAAEASANERRNPNGISLRRYATNFRGTDEECDAARRLEDVRVQLATVLAELPKNGRRMRRCVTSWKTNDGSMRRRSFSVGRGRPADKMASRYNSLSDDLESRSVLDGAGRRNRTDARAYRGTFADGSENRPASSGTEEHRGVERARHKEHEGLNRKYEELRNRFEESERALKTNDGELKKQREFHRVGAGASGSPCDGGLRRCGVLWKNGIGASPPSVTSSSFARNYGGSSRLSVSA